MIHSKKFKSINDAIGKRYQTPFVASVDGMDKILYVSPKKHKNFVIEQDNDFIKSIDAELALTFNVITMPFNSGGEFDINKKEPVLYTINMTLNDGEPDKYDLIDKVSLIRHSEYDKTLITEYTFSETYQGMLMEMNLTRVPEEDKIIDNKQYYALIDSKEIDNYYTVFYIDTLEYGSTTNLYIGYKETEEYENYSGAGITITHTEPTESYLFAYEITYEYRPSEYCLLQINNVESGLHQVSKTYEYDVDNDSYSSSSGNPITYLYIPEDTESIPESIEYESGETTIKVGETYNYSFSNVEYIEDIKFKGFTEKVPDFILFNANSLKSVELPNTITEIGTFAFCDCNSLTSINIPTSLTYIGDYAFAECNNIEHIDIPNSVSYLGDGCFKETKISSINIPDIIDRIGDETFSKCSYLTSVTIPNSVTFIGNAAFFNCNNISPNIPNAVNYIGVSAFYGCNLSSVNINKDVNYIGMSAFSNNPNLSSIVVDALNTRYDSRNNCNAIIETSTNKLIAGCNNTIIPNTVVSIDERVFYGCSLLSSVTIPNSVTEIKDGTFYNCTSLSSVILSDNLTSIGSEAFMDCSSLTSISIPNSVTYIGTYAFENCTSLTSVNIPEEVESIGYCSFRNTRITSAVVPSSVTYLSECTFCRNLSLTSITLNEGLGRIGNESFAFTGITSLVIPSSVTYINEDCVENCSSLTSITMKSTTPPTLYGGWSTNNNSFGGSQCKIYVPYGCKTTYVGDNSNDVWNKIQNRIYELPQEETEP